MGARSVRLGIERRCVTGAGVESGDLGSALSADRPEAAKLKALAPLRELSNASYEIAKLRNTARLSGLREGKSIRRPRCHQV